ncbi:hypothetical protein SAMN04488057_102223 [Cyclobacterium lianum]|uniref:Beta-galactosidase n=1 Tax=Cyclobacterium lianum TaxID=388280 RepID=A0A1M7K0J2_9BACT|nr:hypothetical protein [Cyclobacterium lianum]SHM58327.1 hypothetical protein SAMN04488057_102223 [Cyclobacterium lianum]
MNRPVTLFFILYFFCLVCAPAQNDKWFPFQPHDYYKTDNLNLSDWLDAPAGRHGFVKMMGKDLEFENGQTVKFWGTNINGNKPFSAPEEADRWSRFLAKYGLNAVRFHKFTWEATDGQQSTEIDPEQWKNFDYFSYALRQKGIYYGWSPIYGHRVKPADSARLLAYQEIVETDFPWSHLNGSTASLVNFAEDLQELNIELVVNMLNHKNPHTGLRYADDPALAFVEFQNEDNIFWGAMEKTLEQTPTYRALLCRKFTAWLKNKYGTQANLNMAWNGEGLSEGENLTRENIYPNPNHGFFSTEYEQAITEKRPIKQHVQDKLSFLFEEQARFYRKFLDAVRATGYKGTVVASCWQAGTGLSHLYNLYADYQVGMIDRHNYFGGGSGHNLRAGKMSNASMLSQIGSGLFGTGLQQVSDRPFSLSEWMSLIPTEWTAESSPIIAAYGLGLQGWDASFSFAVDQPSYTPTIQTAPWGGVYNVTSPTQLALYPALAMMIYRGDIIEGETIVDRKVNFDALEAGLSFFDERVIQDQDRKVFKTNFPTEAMAAGRVTLTFTDEDLTDEIGNIAAFKQDGGIVSNTGQLYWTEENRGHFTINSAGTKGLVGFAKNKKVDLGPFSIQTGNEFAVILLSSMDPDKGLEETDRILVTTMARAKNTGMEYNKNKTELLDPGEAPVLIEPVSVELSLPDNRTFSVHVLDHTGNRTGKTLTTGGNRIRINGGETRAIYYEIEF